VATALHRPDFWQSLDRPLDRPAPHHLSTNHMFSVVTNLSSQLTKAQPREASRWASDGVGPRSARSALMATRYTFPGTYQGEMAFLKKWLADRTDFIDTNFLRAPVFSGNGGAITLGLRAYDYRADHRKPIPRPITRWTAPTRACPVAPPTPPPFPIAARSL